MEQPLFSCYGIYLFLYVKGLQGMVNLAQVELE